MRNGNLELPDCVKQISNDMTRGRNTTIDPTGVIISNSTSSSSYEEVNRDSIIIQTLEGYVLPLLPIVPLHIHNIHLKCETLTNSKAYYSELQLPSYRQNIGKYQVLEIDNVPVSYVFYPIGTIDIYTKNSENPFKLQTEEDRVNLIGFIRKIKDNLPHQVTVPDIEYWEFTECDINRDVRISDLVHFAGVKVQVKHVNHLFRIYIKKVGNQTFCRVEETKNLKMPVIEAINNILNPYDRVERQLSEIQHLLNLRRWEAAMNVEINNNLLEVCKVIDPSHLIESDADDISEYSPKKNQVAAIKGEGEVI